MTWNQITWQEHSEKKVGSLLVNFILYTRLILDLCLLGVHKRNSNTRKNVFNRKEWKLVFIQSYFILMQSYSTSPNLLYMCFFEYISSTFFLPLLPNRFLSEGLFSKYWILLARTWVPGRPKEWRRPVTLCSTISFVPPASVPRTCIKNLCQIHHFILPHFSLTKEDLALCSTP